MRHPHELAAVSAALSWTQRASALRPKQPRCRRGRNRREAAAPRWRGARLLSTSGGSLSRRLHRRPAMAPVRCAWRRVARWGLPAQLRVVASARGCLCPFPAAWRRRTWWLLRHGWSSPSTSTVRCCCILALGARYDHRALRPLQSVRGRQLAAEVGDAAHPLPPDTLREVLTRSLGCPSVLNTATTSW